METQNCNETPNAGYPENVQPVPDLTGKSVWILDGHSILYQVFHALPEMTTPDGQPVNALYGFARDLFSLSQTYKPDYLMCAFDVSKHTFRTDLYEAYKGTRQEMPDDLRSQIPKAHELLKALGIPSVELLGYEADDILATVSRLTSEAGGNCVLVTGDKDSRQLLSDRVQIYQIRKTSFYTAAELAADWGVRPDQVVDFQALVGDSSDNVPGVPKIGPKTATALLEQFDSLENLLTHTDQIKSKATRQRIEDNVELARLSQSLVRLKQDVPINIPWSDAQHQLSGSPELVRLMRQWGFKSLLAKAMQLPGSDNSGSDNSGNDNSKNVNTGNVNTENEGSESQNVSPVSVSDSSEIDLFTDIIPDSNVSESAATGEADFSPAENCKLEVCPSRPRYKFLTRTNPDAVEEFLAFLKQNPTEPIAIAAFPTDPGCLASDVPPRQQTLAGLAVSLDGQTGYYLPTCSDSETNLLLSFDDEPTEDGDDRAMAAIQTVLKNPAVLKIGHDLKRSRNLLRTFGIVLDGPTFDTMIADSLTCPGESSHALESVCLRWANWTSRDIQSQFVVKTGKLKTILSLADLKPEDRLEYTGEQALFPRLLYPAMQNAIDKMGLADLARDIEFPLERVLAQMEYTGIRTDSNRLNDLSNEFGRKIDGLKADILSLAGESFNIDSPKQLQTILFDKLRLPKQKKTQTGTSTDADVLQTLAPLHPIAGKILDYRGLTKLKSTYTDALPELIYPPTHRIHCTFNQAATATGRLSSNHPNLQNIPIRSEEGRVIREAFIPFGNSEAALRTPSDAQWILLDADYSQIELRVLAHVCADAALCEAFIEGADIHAKVAAEIFDVPLKEVTSQQRSRAKAVNFGIIYGQSSFGLSKALGISQGEAADFIDRYFAEFPTISQFLDQTLDRCLSQGYVETLWGRRRYLLGIRQNRKGPLNTPERMAINTVIQGTAADIIKAAMVRVQKNLEEQKVRARLLLQIHDELLLEVPPEELEPVRAMLVNTMENVIDMKVPLKVDAKSGANWAEAH